MSEFKEESNAAGGAPTNEEEELAAMFDLKQKKKKKSSKKVDAESAAESMSAEATSSGKATIGNDLLPLLTLPLLADIMNF